MIACSRHITPISPTGSNRTGPAGPVLFDPVGEMGVICREHAINQGLMVRAVRDAMIMSPPLSFERCDIDQMVTLLATALDRTLEGIRQR